jgi:hypothetical protein
MVGHQYVNGRAGRAEIGCVFSSLMIMIFIMQVSHWMERAEDELSFGSGRVCESMIT